MTASHPLIIKDNGSDPSIAMSHLIFSHGQSYVEATESSRRYLSHHLEHTFAEDRQRLAGFHRNSFLMISTAKRQVP
jgi:hypothetical protein